MLRAFSVSAALASLLVLGNCATAAGPDQAAIPEHYVSASSSASAEAAAAKSYALAPMDSRIAPTNADFLEYATYVEQAFGAQGLTRAAPRQAASRTWWSCCATERARRKSACA